MRGKRMWQTIRMYLTWSGWNRARYLRKHNVFRSYGEGGVFMPRIVPLYARLISVGDNCYISSGINFITHDGIHLMARKMGIDPEHKIREDVGCIEIGNNVFVGSGSAILHNVRIGDNVLIAARSVVTKDVPSNSVVAGCPARVISTFDKLIEKRLNAETYPAELAPHRQEISEALVEWCWKDFHEKREKAKETNEQPLQ